MCDVHLVETRRITEPARARLRCSYCGEPVRGVCVIVEGHLDDGSPGLYRFAYHEDCAFDMEHDDEAIDAHQGCFDYGKPLAIDAPVAVVSDVAHGPPAGTSPAFAAQTHP